jgi:hypothetical protein
MGRRLCYFLEPCPAFIRHEHGYSTRDEARRIPLKWPAVWKLVEDFFHRLVNELLEDDPLDRLVNSLIFANSPGNEGK